MTYKERINALRSEIKEVLDAMGSDEEPFDLIALASAGQGMFVSIEEIAGEEIGRRETEKIDAEFELGDSPWPSLTSESPKNSDASCRQCDVPLV